MILHFPAGKHLVIQHLSLKKKKSDLDCVIALKPYQLDSAVMRETFSMWKM